MKPFSLYKCGHPYCIKCIDTIMQTQKQNAKCPCCNQLIVDKIPCFGILQMISQEEQQQQQPLIVNANRALPSKSTVNTFVFILLIIISNLLNLIYATGTVFATKTSTKINSIYIQVFSNDKK